MFASKTLAEHLLRGLVALVCGALVLRLGTSHPWVAFVAAPIALVALRGCPMCWTVGLLETLRGRRTRGPKAPGCATGTCDG